VQKKSLGTFISTSDKTDSYSDIELALQQNTQPTGTTHIPLRHAISNKISKRL
jgi:hypothetical protein